tara:strand:- start:155 stop:1135 length:981 start_codon:yes stop_codon:yes gene_type:complete
MIFRKLPTSSACPDVSWFKKLPLPSGRSFICTGRQKMRLDQIERVNGEGQVVNIARELGTDKQNVQDLQNSIKIRGVLVDVQPPYVGTNYKAQDGFSRLEAIQGLGLEFWVVNVVKPKKGFTWTDVSTEIGLGANNHPPSKSATRGDFTKALSRWIVNQEQQPTQGQCIDWMNNIQHCFSQEVVSNIVRKALQVQSAKSSVESVDSKSVITKVRQELDHIADTTDILAFNISGNDTYYKRAAFDVLKSISNPKKSDRLGVGYTKDIPAEQMTVIRDEGLNQARIINELFETAFQLRMKKGDSFKLLDIKYMMPQIIDVETSLIPVE